MNQKWGAKLLKKIARSVFSCHGNATTSRGFGVKGTYIDKKPMTDIKKFTEAFNRIAHNKSEETVFTDYLDMVICALSGGKYEEEYLSIVKGYSRKEMDMFCELMAEMLISMDNNGAGLVDCLGEFYQNNLSRGKHGQFFTPQNVSDFMAEITMDKSTTGKTIHDPACGSGRMLLAAAKVSRDNYFTGADVDSRCAKMCVINLCLNGLRGEVAHMNSLSSEIWLCYAIEYLPVAHLRVPIITRLPANTGVIYNNTRFRTHGDLQKPDKDGNVITVTQTKLDFGQ